MELPNHSKQLLRQLHTLQKEHQFCDCTILIGTGQFRAHKLVLAASSSLFKSLLQDTDTVSINSSVVSPDEFTLLLEMVYSGKLPPGKHNFSRIISAADSLQMVDVAMSCMDFLANVMGQQGPKDSYKVTSQKDSGSKNVLGKKNKHSHSDWGLGVPRGVRSQDEIFARSSGPTSADRDGAEGSRDEPAIRRGRFTFPDAEGSRREPDFPPHRDVVEALGNSSSFLERAKRSQEMSHSEKQVIADSVSGGERQVFERPLEEACGEKDLAAGSLLSVLDLCQDTDPSIHAALQEQNPSQLGEPHKAERDIEENSLFALLLERRDELVHSVTELSPILECLDTAEEGFLTDYEKQVIFSCCIGESHRGAIRKLLYRVEQEKALSPDSLLRLLRRVKEAFPNLKLLLEQLERQTDKQRLEDYGIELLELNQKNIIEILRDPELLRQGLSQARDIPAKDRQTFFVPSL